MIEVAEIRDSPDDVAAFLNSASQTSAGGFLYQRWTGELLSALLGPYVPDAPSTAWPSAQWLGAYEGSRLVGTLMTRRLRVRVGHQLGSGGLGSGLSVHPHHRGHGIARQLIDTARRLLHAEPHGHLCSVGFVDTGPDAARTWHRTPDIVPLGMLGWWVHVCDPSRLVRWYPEPLSPRLLHAVAQREPLSRDPPDVPTSATLRPWTEADLPAVAALWGRRADGADLALIWDADALRPFLRFPQQVHGLVYVEGGDVIGWIASCIVEEVGRTSERAANIDFLATSPGRSDVATLLLRAALWELRRRGVLTVSLLGTHRTPQKAARAAGFLPLPRDVEAVAVYTQPATRPALAAARRLALVYR
ncbi:MAG TPA: GNAT family N-acetyltransferase [Pseudomonadota bacterium]|nr:GNAT family N-acetyltransferase [Pseudomonadota bacterium]